MSSKSNRCEPPSPTHALRPSLRYSTLIALVVIGTCAVLRVHAQPVFSAADSSFLQVGQTGSVGMALHRVSPASIDTLECVVHLSNPTVFYPQIIRSSGSGVVETSLDRVNDSVYHARIIVNAFDTTVSMHLDGEALAGNDSLCIVSFKSIRCQQRPLASRQSVLISRSIGTTFPYLRFASLSVARPNPCEGCAGVRFVYRVDRATPLDVDFFDPRGKLIRIIHTDVGAGSGEIELVPDYVFDAGVYLVRMRTNTGVINQSFVIVN